MKMEQKLKTVSIYLYILKLSFTLSGFIVNPDLVIKN